MTILLITAHVLLFGGVFALIATMFRSPELDIETEGVFSVSVDNVERNTLFEFQPLKPLTAALYQLARRLNVPGFKRHLMQLLLGLGNPNQYSPDEYLVLCLAWGGLLAVAAPLMVLVSLGPEKVGPIGGMAYGAAGFFAGFLGCYFFLRERTQVRLRKIARRLPYTLDLIAMAMDAGATFYEAAQAVIRDDPEDPMNQELAIVVREIDFGRSRQDALTHLGERIDVEGLDGIISAVLQAEKLGTPLATVLKLQANLLRMRRSMRAERKAGEATVKMLVPMMLILISVVLIIFGPFIVRFLRGEYSLG
jgi:tight adherence protein C